MRRRPTACAPRWADARPAGCARTRSSCRRGCRRTPQASDAVFEVFHDTTPVVEPLSVDEAFLDVSGLRRVSGTPVEIAARLRAAGPRPRRPADHRRHRPHQVPRQGGQPGGQARRAAARPARPRAGVPASAAGAPAVGRRRQDRGEAARARHRDRRRRRRAERVDARRDGRRRDGPSAVRVVPQHRSAPGGDGGAPPLGRRAARPRAARQHDVGRGGRRRRDQPDRPDHPPDAQGRAHRPNGGAAVAVRRLRPRHPVTHHAAGDRVNRRHPRGRP